MEKTKTLVLVALSLALGYMVITGFAPEQERDVKVIVIFTRLGGVDVLVKEEARLKRLLAEGYDVQAVYTVEFDEYPLTKLLLTK